MKVRATALRVKMNAEIHAETCSIASNWRFGITTISLLLAAGAAAVALYGRELWDCIFAVLVLAVLILEAVIFGYRHWQEEAERSHKFTSLAEKGKPVSRR